MAGLRIWHLMVAVAAAALLVTVARIDSSCTPFALSYLCGVLGLLGARWRGRRARTRLLGLILLLGPLGVLVACSNPVPEGWPETERKPTGAS
jgi:hypothetical protein